MRSRRRRRRRSMSPSRPTARRAGPTLATAVRMTADAVSLVGSGRPGGVGCRSAVTCAERGRRRHRGGHQEDRHQRAGQPTELEPHHERDGEAERTSAAAGGTEVPRVDVAVGVPARERDRGRRARRRRRPAATRRAMRARPSARIRSIGPKIGTTAHTPTQIASTLVPGRSEHRGDRQTDEPADHRDRRAGGAPGWRRRRTPSRTYPRPPRRIDRRRGPPAPTSGR